ncbi:glycerate kinase [Candidatus Lokiarchaeum ossiferum]|uniref:glycerate kinase n=1 Tax=Candidatus Lokiarchaeum ossiferum TaxID=2951803 RepID=UPI00352E46D5
MNQKKFIHSKSPFSKILSIAQKPEISLSLRQLRQIGLESIVCALEAVLPQNLIESYVSISDDYLQIGSEKISVTSFKKILILGGGKASGGMCQALLAILQDRFEISGLINIPYGQNIPDLLVSPQKKAKVNINFCAHPVPDESGLNGVQEMLSKLRNSSHDTLVITLISGGGSALMPYPAQGISLDEIKSVNRLLLECGASIQEINCIRKHISNFKGGQLARVAVPRRIYSLIISDVVGNDLQTIASGPTVPDQSTFHMAKQISEKYQIFSKFPLSVQQRIDHGTEGCIPETPKPGADIFSSAKSFIIGSAETSANRVCRYLIDHQIIPHIFSHNLQGEAQLYGQNLISLIESYKNEERTTALIGTGEFTVKIHGNGVGGRNQEMLLGFLSHVSKNSDNVLGDIEFVIIAGAFDGIEGNSSAMGAIIDSESLQRMNALELDPKLYLQNNDSYHFFQHLGDNLITGQTGTNVNDMVLILIKRKELKTSALTQLVQNKAPEHPTTQV